MAGPAGDSLESFEAQTHSLQQQLEEAESRLLRELPNLDPIASVPSLEAVVGRLPASSALIEFAEFLNVDVSSKAPRSEMPRAHLAAFVVKAGLGNVRFFYVGESERIDLLVSELRAGLTGEVDALDRPDPARLTGVFHPAGQELTVARATRSKIDAFGIQYEGNSAFSTSQFSWAA